MLCLHTVTVRKIKNGGHFTIYLWCDITFEEIYVLSYILNAYVFTIVDWDLQIPIFWNKSRLWNLAFLGFVD